MSGLYEIHITVDHNQGFYNLLNFVNSKKNMKILFAISRSNNYQYMVTHFTCKETIEQSVDKALSIATQLEKHNITILRTKVEMRNTINMPIDQEAYNILKHHLDQTYNHTNGKPYFEFHLKISNTGIDLDKLEDDVNQFENSVISYNLCSIHKKPILTIRMYDTGYKDATNYKNTVVNSLKQLGYVFEDKIQEEFSVYDSNQSVDDGWIQ